MNGICKRFSRRHLQSTSHGIAQYADSEYEFFTFRCIGLFLNLCPFKFIWFRNLQYISSCYLTVTSKNKIKCGLPGSDFNSLVCGSNKASNSVQDAYGQSGPSQVTWFLFLLFFLHRFFLLFSLFNLWWLRIDRFL